jgi:branched-chain amino acid transport system permease protein
MLQVAQLAFDASSLGALYALTALGVGLVFGVMRLINFAYGDYITWTAYGLLLSGFWFVSNDLPYLLTTVVVATATPVLLALLTERVAFRPLRDADPATLLIGSFAVSYLLQNLILMGYGGRPQSLDIGGWLSGVLVLGGLRLAILDLVTIAACGALIVGLTALLRWTRLGIYLRASAENFGMTRLLGVRADSIIAAAFVISGLLAATVSVLVVAKLGVVNYQLGVPLVLVAFIGTVVGGIGSIFGAALGGFLIGFISMACQHWLPPDLRDARDAFVFAFVVAVLLVRPRGLIASLKAAERV